MMEGWVFFSRQGEKVGDCVVFRAKGQRLKIKHFVRMNSNLQEGLHVSWGRNEL